MSQPQPQLENDVPALVAAARRHRDEGRLDEAALLLEPRCDPATPDPDIAYALAGVRVRQGRLAEARELLQAALRERYEDVRFHSNLGVVCDMLGRSDEAIRAFRRAIQLAPGDPLAHLNLGALYGELGRYEDAARALRRSVELRADYDALFNLGLVHYRQGDLAEAERWFDRAARERGAGGLVHHYRGQCRFKRGLTRDAIGIFREALAVEPQLASARLALGMALNKAGEYRAAVSELERVARVLADDGRVHYQLGIAHDGLGQKAQARDSYRRARTLAG